MTKSVFFLQAGNDDALAAQGLMPNPYYSLLLPVFLNRAFITFKPFSLSGTPAEERERHDRGINGRGKATKGKVINIRGERHKYLSHEIIKLLLCSDLNFIHVNMGTLEKLLGLQKNSHLIP